MIILFLNNGLSNNSIINPFISTSPFPTIKTNDRNETATISPSFSNNIEVLNPRSGDSIRSGFRIEGNARTFENSVAIRLSDSDENILIETLTMANSSDMGKFGPFEKILNFQTNSTEGFLEVFQYSAKDGSEIDKVKIPVIFN